MNRRNFLRCAGGSAFAFMLRRDMSAAAPAGQVAVGRISEVEGNVKVSGKNGQAREMKIDSVVFLDDRIVTAAGARVVITLSDESDLSQGENAEMVIDQYIYAANSGKSDVNCAVSFVRGIFRVITGKIVQLNPERFKVRTRMASIGIRGCELGFRVGDEDEDAYVFDLPPGHTVEIEQAGDGSAVGQAKQRLTIREAGQAVNIGRNRVFKTRKLSVEERKKFCERVLPGRALERLRQLDKERLKKDFIRDRILDDRPARIERGLQKDGRKPIGGRKPVGKP